jgi:molybdenum cofactor biosynthesis enzyme
MEGLPINAPNVLREFQRWLSRSGYKYPMVGCRVNASDVQAAVRFAIAATGCVIERKHLASLIALAQIGAANVLRTKSAPCITAAKKVLRRMPECRDTESSQTTPQG